MWRMKNYMLNLKEKKILFNEKYGFIANGRGLNRSAHMEKSTTIHWLGLGALYD